MKNKRGDVTVSEAANSLGVTTRSVLNYIKAKEIEALKVGKSWYINKASLDSFSKRFGFYKAEPPRPTEIRKGDHNFPKNEETEENGQAKYSVKNLRLFKRAKEILSGLTIDEADTPSELKLRVSGLKYSAIELLGAGYYSYEPRNKLMLYNQSRQKVGAILALVYFKPEEMVAFKKVINDIEDELLPAYSALIKRIDKKSESNREKYKNL